MDRRGREWDEREKTNVGRLRLPPMALDIIRSQPKLAGNPYALSGRNGGPFNSFSERKAELEQAMPESTDRWVLHDLRRTCRKLMTRAKVLAGAFDQGYPGGLR
jgi:hypothetical protein